MYLANLIFVVSRLEMLQKFWRHCSQKETFIQSLLAFVILMI